MPLREYGCAACGKVTVKLFEDGYPKTVDCDHCGERASHQYSTFGISVGFRDGYDHGAGAYFNTARERDNYLAEHNLRKWRHKPKGKPIGKG